jgi:superfamily II DNA or RNA helicase
MVLQTCLDRRGYVLTGLDAATAADLRKELTVAPLVNPNAPMGAAARAEAEAPFPVYRDLADQDGLLVPRAFGLERWGVPTLSAIKEVGGTPIHVQFVGDLRADQREPVRSFLEAARDPSRMGGLLEMRCAAGKTVQALYIACQLGWKTLVVCHKSFLMAQWKERLAQFVPSARIGSICQDKVDVSGKDFVLASLQSLAMRPYGAYPEHVFDEFGLVVVDECHHVAAQVFSRALHRIVRGNAVTLGLSATMARKDGLRRVFEWWLGRPAFVMRRCAAADVGVRVRLLDVPAPLVPHEHPGIVDMPWSGKPNVAAMVNRLSERPSRNDLIVQAWRDALQEDPGRRVLVLSERRAHLSELQRRFEAESLGLTGMYVGGMKQADLDATARDAKVCLATVQMASEGLDVKGLDTLLLACISTSDIEQMVGRILRDAPEQRARAPLVIDLQDGFSVFAAQARRRRAFYRARGWLQQGSGAGAGAGEDDGYSRPQPRFAFRKSAVD